jgi:fibronectin-binding autotransporter adhesin
VKSDFGTLVLTGTNTYTGGTAINSGTLRISADANLGDAAGGLSFNGGTLNTTANVTSGRAVTLDGAGTVLTDAGTATTLSGGIAGAGGLTKDGAGSLVLTGDATHTGGTTIAAGTLQIGAGGTSGTLAGAITNNATLAFNRSDDLTVAGPIAGTGGVNQIGTGVATLTGANSYTGTTNVQAGTLIINGNQSGATGATSVASGAALGGIGTIGGDVTVADGGAINPGGVGDVAGTLAINGSLTLGATSTLNYNLGAANAVGGSLNDLITVGGNLTLDGMVNVTTTPGGNFGPGIYRLIDYAGTLIDHGLELGTMPDGSHVTVQTSALHQINLVNSAGLPLNYWDGGAAGQKNNGIINGGDGTWRAAGDDNWTGEDGAINDAFANGDVAIFMATPGTVFVDNSQGPVSVSGMQFASNGYTILGAPITLVGPQTTIRVGDGTSASASFVATIGASLTGDSQLVKSDFGTLVLTGTNSYTGGTAINSGTLRISADANLGDAAGGLSFNGGTLNTTANVTSGRAVTLDGAGTVLTDAGTATTLSGGIAGAGGLTKDGEGSLVLTGDATHTGGTTITDGILQVGDGGTSGTLAGNVTNNGTLAFDRSDVSTFGGAITGTGDLQQTGTGTTILTGDSSYTGGTTITDGALQLGDGGTAGSITGDVANDGTLAFSRSDDVAFAGVISGTGRVDQIGTGTTTLTGANSYAGPTNVNAGTLLVNGDESGATGLTSVASGAILGGTGTIGGDVTVADGGAINPGDAGDAPGTLTANGNVALAGGSILNYNFGQANVPGGAFNDLLTVHGDLTLGGTLNVTQTAGGSFGPGVYRVISYDGTLTNNGLGLGTTPADSDLFVQTSVANQVNLVNTTGLTLNFWDGDAGPKNDGAVNGGSGTWQNSTGNDNWTDSTGMVNAPYSDGAFAIFQGAAGTVTVDNSLGNVSVSGMQFTTDGYVIQGDAITLVADASDPSNASTIRVGDGTAAGAGYMATIASVLTGTQQLVKTDLGTLVLSGTNTYTGGTAITGGTVRISSDANLGDAAGGLSFNGGTLNTTADVTSGRDVTLDGTGTFLTDTGTTTTLSGSIAGAGGLTKDGEGSLVLTGDASHSGGTTIAAGTLRIGDGGTSGTLAGNVTNNGTLAFDRSDVSTFGGAITGTGDLQQIGTGTTILTGDSSYTGGTTIADGTLQLGDGGTSGSITGDVTNNGTLAISRSDDVALAGAISGSGGVDQIGTGTTTLTGANSYAGPTTVQAGTLLVNGDQSGATGATSVASGAILGGTGTIGGDVTVADGGAINPGPAGDAPGTLAVKGNLALAANSTLNYNFGQANTPGGTLNDLLDVGGDVTLGGTLNVTTTAGGSFGPGIYRVIRYDGQLTSGTLALGAVPADAQASVQTSIPHQVNLVNTAGLALRFWDGAAGPKNDGAINGGDGTWQNSTGNDNWTDQDGVVNAPYTDAAFAVFQGAAGTVTVDTSLGSVKASGMQFDVNGYRITGDPIELAGPKATIRVGAGSVGEDYVATIDAILTGNSQLEKTDPGTLVLSGTNTYTGGTAINGGTIQIASDANLGEAAGGLSFNGGTLNTTADVTSGRDVTLDGAGTFQTDAGTTTTLTGAIAGAGAFTKGGAGSLVLTGDATHTGGTTIAAGTLQIGNGGTSGTLAGDVTNNGTLAFDRSDDLTFAGVISGAGAVQQLGTGRTILTGDSSYTGGTTIAAGTLQLGNGGTSGSLTGDVTNNGTLAFNRSDARAFAGVISGSGGVDQIGTGTTTLTGANSYAGPTTVQAGTLLVNGDQSGATGLTTVASGATLGGTGTIGGGVTVADGAINPGQPNAVGTLTINGGLALAGGSVLNVEFGQANVEGGALNDLIKVGGDLTLDGTLNVTTAPGGSFGPGLYRVISYGGTLTDNGLALGSMPAGSAGSLQSSIAHQVNLINGGSSPLSYWDGDLGPKNDGVINGGDGIWRANGDDNWTDVNGATNAPYSDGSFAIFAATPGRVTVDSTNGEVRSSGMQFATDGYAVQGDAIALTGTQAIIRVGDGTAEGAGYRATIASALTGSAGLAKTDLGTLALTGTNSYSGATDVIGGTLAVDGSIANSAVTVHDGARLTGNGTVGATSVATGGTIAPGHSIGTLHVAGGYGQQAGSTYAVEVDPTSTASDRIEVTGTAELQSGAALSVSKTTDAPYKLGTRYTVLTTTDGLRGSFAVTGDTALTAFAGLTDIYDANNAYLVVAQTRSFTTAAGTPNQNAVARGLDGLPPTSSLLTALINLPNDAGARQAFDQLSGEVHASVKTALMEESHFVRDAATDRIREAFCAAGANVTSHQNLGMPLPLAGAQQPPDECEGDDRVTLWGQAFGSWGHTDGNGNAASLTRSIGGFFLGADAPVTDNVRLGVLGGYGRGNVDVRSRNSSGTSDDYHIGVYGGTAWGALGVRGGVTYTWHDLTTTRSVAFPGFGDTLTARYDAGTTQVFGDVGYRIDARKAALEPFANLAYVNLQTDDAAERGGAAALTGRSKDTDTSFATLGLRGTVTLPVGDVIMVARGSLGWRHAFGETTPQAGLSFPGGSPFSITGVPIAKNAAALDAGVDFGVAENAQLSISYGGQFATDAVDQSVRGNFNLKF